MIVMMGAARAWERHRGSRWRRTPAGRACAADALDAARRVARQLAGGLSPEVGDRIAGDLRDLLGAQHAVLLTAPGPARPGAWEAADPSVDRITREVAGAGRAQRSGEWFAAPVIADGELRGVLVARGPGLSLRVVTSLASWLGDALERGRLETAREDLELAELGRLRAQISPHFLSNSLSAITSLIRSDPERARELLLQFAQYARYSLTSHGAFVTLAEEFRAVEAYLQLERARFGPRLTTSLRVAPELLAVSVPVLVLQPLVENGIRHGIERRPGPGKVTVTGRTAGMDCLITVEDDGVGMEPQRAEALLAGEGPDAGTGLANVDRRLRAVYGDEYGLVLETAPDAGTKVTVRLPRSPSQPRFARGAVR